MIDTLKLSRRLEGAGMDWRQAEELADGLGDGLRDGLEHRLERLDHHMSRHDTDIGELKSDVKLLKWMVRFNLALTTGVLAKLLVG